MGYKNREPEVIGQCEICGRDMIKGSSIDEHHWIPQLKGGTHGPKSYLHRICHNKLHSIWKETELANTYNNPATILENEEIQIFVKWLQNKAPDFYVSTRLNKSRKRR